MCGRYTLIEPEAITDRFTVDKAEMEQLLGELRRRYNIGPGQNVPIVHQDDKGRHVTLMRWGYLPFWAKDINEGYKYINARSESVFEKPTWKKAILHSRCIVPSNGFYEWVRLSPKEKQPFYIHPKDQETFGYAGVWSKWKDVEGTEWKTFAILTTTPNKEMEAIHDRMPVILKPEDESHWLEPSNDSPEFIAEFLRPYEDGMLETYEVSRDVNTTRSDDGHLIEPINSQ